MSTQLDVAGILERAGADADAPEGCQAWALAQVSTAVADLIEHNTVMRAALSACPCFCQDEDEDGDAAACDRCAALARVGGAA